jgi:hypothetical protein
MKLIYVRFEAVSFLEYVGVTTAFTCNNGRASADPAVGSWGKLLHG